MLKPSQPPFRPFRDGSFTSRLHSEWIAARLGMILGICITICFFTGLFSHFQQHPVDWLPLSGFPSWGYRVTQGAHVATGLACIPLVLIKLWSVYPKLFVWPPIRSVLHLVELASIAVLVGSMLFQLVTGTLNIAQWYPWTFSFTTSHYAVAWILAGSVLLHVAVKAPAIARGLRKEPDPDSAPSVDEPAPAAEDSHAGMSRRGLLVAAGLAVGTVTVVTVGQTVPWLQSLGILAPRKPSDGPQGLPINKTAHDAGITSADTGDSYRLTVMGPRQLSMQLAELHSMPQRQVSLPIACVEGWSANALWEGIRLSDLLDAAGIAEGATIQIVSLQKSGGYATSTMTPAFARDPTTLLALRVNNVTLSPDHGYPARIIAPNRPGVLQTKWVTRLEAL